MPRRSSQQRETDIHNSVAFPEVCVFQTIAAVATALKQVADPSFKQYAKQVIANARTLAAELVGHGYKIQTGGTDNHLVLWDLRPVGLTGSKVEKICDILGITINSTFHVLLDHPSQFIMSHRECCVW